MKSVYSLILLTLTLFLFVSISIGQTEKKKNIAVIDLDSRGGLSEAEIGTLTDRMRSMLVRTQAFNVIDRGLMEEVLSEQGFQMSGCTSTDCAVEAGKILGVEQMVSGTIGKLGKLYTVDVILIDVSTSQIIKSLTRDYSGEIEGLIGLMKSIADELAGAEKSYQIKPPKKEIVTGISVKTEPPGANVFLNDVMLGQTPYENKKLNAGKHRLKIEKKGYKTIEGKLIIEKGKVKPFDTKLQRLFSVKITSRPIGATIFINGKNEGKTPYSLNTEDNKKLALKLEKTNYQPFEKSLLIKKDESFDIKMEYTQAYKDYLARNAAEKSKPVIKTEEKSSGSSTWLWVGGGAVVIAAAVYFLLPKDDETKTPVGASFPLPPERPPVQ